MQDGKLDAIRYFDAECTLASKVRAVSVSDAQSRLPNASLHGEHWRHQYVRISKCLQQRHRMLERAQ
jgi:hypothetical protein